MSSTAITPVLECHNLSKRYRQGELDVNVLQDINLAIREGEKLAIMGASGSGKSTLLHLLGGLDKPSSGDVILAGKSLARLRSGAIAKLRNEALGFVYQFHHLLAEFTLTENVAMPLIIRGMSVATASMKAAEMLAEVGLDKRLKHKPAELSGGERQRAAIARALVSEPLCVLADEPTGNLDSRTAEGIYQLIERLNSAFRIAFIIVTHDPALAARMDSTKQMIDGQLK